MRIKIPYAALAFLALVTVVVWNISPQRNLVVSFLDVGQGDAILLTTPDDHQILIDGGPDASVLQELGGSMPFWDRSLDLVILTHPDRDHVGGLPEVLSRYHVVNVLAAAGAADTAVSNAFSRAVEHEGATVFTAGRGQVLEIGEVTLTVIYPDVSAQSRSVNDTSTVIRLDYGETSLLLTGDIEKSVESYLLSFEGVGDLLDTDVLKVAHHGSDTSSSAPFLSAVSPEYVVISAGEDNRYGHPDEGVVSNLERFSENVVCTCDVGRVVLESDGKRWSD